MFFKVVVLLGPTSRPTKRRFDKGLHDGNVAMKQSPWLEPVSRDIGIAIHEICQNPEELGMLDKEG